MKNFRLLAIAAAIAASPAAHAQWTVNVNSDIPATINQIQTMAQWAKQYENMIQQINHLKSQYNAITGVRNLGQILNDPSLRSYLPDEWAGIYSKVTSGSLVGLSSSAKAIALAEGFGTATGARKRQQDVLASNKAMTMAAYDASLKRLQNINSLMEQANAQSDMKGAADLANRMAAENAMIQNEQTRLNLLAQLQVAEEKLAADQRAREFDTAFAK